MQRGLWVLLVIIFLAGCVKGKPSPSEMGADGSAATGPRIRKFCVVGPGFENKKCLQDAAIE